MPDMPFAYIKVMLTCLEPKVTYRQRRFISTTSANREKVIDVQEQ
jgi:hypothetical protein